MTRSYLWLLAAIPLVGACTKESSDKGGGDNGVSQAKLDELEKRIAALEAEQTKNEGAMGFLSKVYDANKEKMEEEERQTHAEDAIFAVDIAGNQFDGPASGAYVTVIEAWDFA
jgi:hypothetical protein